MSLPLPASGEIHSFYSAQTSSILKAIGSSDFSAELDAFMRELVLGLWHCEAITDAHAAIINEICSKNAPKPTYLYWELVSAAASSRRITIPDFYRALVLLDSALGKSICADITALAHSLLLRLCSGVVPGAEASYINSVVTLLTAAAKAQSITEFSDSVPAAEPPQAAKPACSTAEAETGAAPSSGAEAAESVEALLAELDSLVGMDQIKKDVRSLINLIKVRRLRAENSLAVPALSLHMVFTGNPGTGKTTVARLLSRLYHAIGVLENGTLVEVDRSGLVAGYVGQTAIKTQEVIDKAAGGILFIDEAYALAPASGGNDFGQEAIETILKAMEDRRDELVVIAAGYPEPMERFISSNPGLESRFGKYFHFDDYSGAELFEIFKSMCKKSQYEPDSKALDFAKKLFADLYESRDENFGNARDVRNIFEKAVSRQSDRVAQLEAPTREDLITLTKADLDPEL